MNESTSSPKDSIPQAALTRYFREVSCVILRNEEDLVGNFQRGGDLDLLVADLEHAETTLIRHLGPPVRLVRSSYVSGYSYDWGHIDLLPTLEWRGASYLRTEAVLGSLQISSRGRPVARIGHQALISWLTNLLFAGVFKARYAADIRKAVEIEGDAFRRMLIEATGNKWGNRLWRAAIDGHPEISADWIRSLRVAVWSRACVRSPVRTIQRFVAFVVAELKLRVKPPSPWIAVGSSSLANAIVHRVAACPFANVKVCEWRSRSDVGESSWDLLVLAADWLMGYWTAWVHFRAKGYVLLMHGPPVAVLLDPKRERSGAARWIARALGRLLPKPNLLVFHDSEPDALANDIQRDVRAWMLNRSLATLGGRQGSRMVAAPASYEGSSSAATLLIRDNRTR